MPFCRKLVGVSWEKNGTVEFSREEMDGVHVGVACTAKENIDMGSARSAARSGAEN